jgi:hypothetical protein
MPPSPHPCGTPGIYITQYSSAVHVVDPHDTDPALASGQANGADVSAASPLGASVDGTSDDTASPAGMSSTETSAGTSPVAASPGVDIGEHAAIETSTNNSEYFIKATST